MILSHRSSDRIERLEWIKDIPTDKLDYVIIHGDPTLESEYSYSPDTHICRLKCPDDYLNLCTKIKCAINFILTEFNSSFVLKIDDDVIVNMQKLIEYIDQSHCEYEGVISYNYGVVYCGGPLYYLSRASLERIKGMVIDGFTYQEDACVGRCLSRHKGTIRVVNTYTNNINEMHTSIAYHDNLRILFSGIPASETIPDSAKTVTMSSVYGVNMQSTTAPKPTNITQPRFSILSFNRSRR